MAAVLTHLWFGNDQAIEAATFYAEHIPDSAVTRVLTARSGPGAPVAEIVEFTVAGIPCVGLNGGPVFPHSEAFSFQVHTDTQEQTDRYWNAIVGNGGQESACGWCKDKWGLNWQITPRILIEATTSSDKGVAKRAFDAMMTMKKIDIAAIETAVRGDAVGAA